MAGATAPGRNVDASGAAAPTRLSALGLLDLAIVYLIWGSTFLAMRIGVCEDGGVAPWWFGGTRVLAAAILLVLIVAVRSHWRPRDGTPSPWRLDRSRLVALAISGNLIWVTGHGIILWTEVHAESGYAALFIASFPIWAAGFDAALDRRWPSPRLVAWSLLGLTGVGLLLGRQWTDPDPLPIGVIIGLIMAPITWAAGFTWQRRHAPGVDPFVSSMWQHVFAFPGLLLIAVLLREPFPMAPGADVVWAWLYLVVFGSAVAFTAAHGALKLLPSQIAMTYAYVNPVVAVILGHIVLNEVVGVWTVAGAAAVLLAVGGIFGEGRSLPRRRPVEV